MAHELQIKLPTEKFYRTVETWGDKKLAEIYERIIKELFPFLQIRINSDELQFALH